MPNHPARAVLRGALPGLLLALVACASSPPVQAQRGAFDGTWGVRWCDRTAPEAECGGFTVDLKQTGDQLSGESFGARARLAQTDEGGVVRGIVVGDRAVLTVESLRSGAIYLVQASLRGECMHWKMRDTVRKAERDIDVIAFDDVLARHGPGADNAALEAAEARCRQGK